MEVRGTIEKADEIVTFGVNNTNNRSGKEFLTKVTEFIKSSKIKTSDIKAKKIKIKEFSFEESRINTLTANKFLSYLNSNKQLIKK